MPLSAGDKLGPYVVTAPIGAGGMGEVYKARDTRLDRTVAIKVLPEHIAKRDDLRARFEREARAVASLNHPNICTLYDIGNLDGVGGFMFDTSHHYSEPADGINVPITLCRGRQSVELLAKLDTGAAHCIFERKYAEMLGLEVESGRLQRFRTVAGLFSAYEHEVTIETLGIEFSATVFFAQDSAFNRNFLGRSGWLDRLRIAIIDYDRTLFLSPYQS